MLKSRDNGFSVYYPGVGWMGSLNTVTPGMGLMYESHGQGTMTLTYPATGKSEPLKRNASVRDNHWIPVSAPYPDNMTLLAVVAVGDDEVRSEQYELGVFAGNECRGSAKLKYEAALDRYVAYVTIFGAESVPLRFGLYDMNTGEERFDSEMELLYESNVSYGTPSYPCVVRFTNTTGLEGKIIRVGLFPNPVDRGETLWVSLEPNTESSVCMEVVNELGVVVAKKIVSEDPIYFQAPEIPGMYLLRITVAGEGRCYRKLVVR